MKIILWLKLTFKIFLKYTLYSKNDFVIMDLSSMTREEVGAEQQGVFAHGRKDQKFSLKV